MPNSNRYKLLDRRLKELRRHFLPKTFSPTGNYTARQLDLARAYRLLSHAEIESFIEDISKETVLSKINAWQRSRKPSDLLICFLACYHAGWATDDEGSEVDVMPPTLPKIKVKEAAEEAVQMALNQYMQKVKTNNGIREKDLKKLVLPIGVRTAELDATWVTTLDDFGKQRGETAHNSVGVLQPIDPLTELNTINQLLTGLQKLDEMIVKIAK